MIRSSKTWQALAVTAAAGLALSACGTTDTGGGGDDAAADCNFKIGVMGALSGANASIVLPSVDGAELAVKQWDNEDCTVSVEKFDTEGDPAKATPVATQIAGDDSFIGVMGGAFSGETRATKAIFGDAGVTMISQSATATDLTQDDPSPVFHRIVPYDDYQGAAIAQYLTDEVGATKVFVVDNSEAYGEPLADRVEETLGDAMVAARQDAGRPDRLRADHLQDGVGRARRRLLRWLHRRGRAAAQADARRRHRRHLHRW